MNIQKLYTCLGMLIWVLCGCTGCHKDTGGNDFVGFNLEKRRVHLQAILQKEDFESLYRLLCDYPSECAECSRLASAPDPKWLDVPEPEIDVYPHWDNFIRWLSNQDSRLLPVLYFETVYKQHKEIPQDCLIFNVIHGTSAWKRHLYLRLFEQYTSQVVNHEFVDREKVVVYLREMARTGKSEICGMSVEGLIYLVQKQISYTEQEKVKAVGNHEPVKPESGSKNAENKDSHEGQEGK